MSAKDTANIDSLKEAFKLFDSDGDGVITKEELGAIMNSLGHNATPTEIEDLINDIDLDQSGTLDLDEFIKMMTMVAKPANFEEEMRSAFKVFDKDGSGTISKDEMAQVMKLFGDSLTNEDLDVMLREVDKNGDGTIDYEEFVNFFKGA